MNSSYEELPRGVRGRYQVQDSAMTLREGLAEYYAVNPGLNDPGTVAPSMKSYFQNHDATHVVFGTHTGDVNEGINDLWTLFGVDVAFRAYAGELAASKEGKEISKHYARWETVSMLFHTLRLLPKVYRHAKRMTRKWPWTPPPAFYDRSLRDLREEFGVRVIHV